MIGFFDSGFGGLTILKEILGVGAEEKFELADYDVIYLGDTARAPYGSRSPEVIYDWTREAVEYLFKQGCELVILACFSASAAALRRLQQEYLPSLRGSEATVAIPSISIQRDCFADARNDTKNALPPKRVLGVLIPLAEQADKISRFGRIGILGTRATINSGALVTELKKRRENLEIYSQAAPFLVPLIEEGWLNRPETKRILRYYLRPLKEKGIDTLLLACTHYPLLYKEIKAVMGKQIKVINPGKIVAESLRDYLRRHLEIDRKLSKKHQRRFLTTDKVEDFERLGSKFLGERIKAEKIEIG